jgi:hypothetical protein
MPVVPQPNAQGIVRSLGFNFDFIDAVSTTATQLGIPVNTSFSTLQTSLGVSTDTYPAQQTAWGRANQALANSSMVWDFKGQLEGSTVCNLASLPAPNTNKWTTTYQVIRTMTGVIPAGWRARNSTTITLFIFNTFSATANLDTLQYFEYSINSETTYLPLAETSATKYYQNTGQSQYNAITGVLTNVPLATGDVIRVRFWGRTKTGSLVMSNPTEQAWGVFSTVF